MQVAARRVAEENRSLRTLLKTHGISTDVVDAHLRPTAIDVASPSIWTRHPNKGPLEEGSDRASAQAAVRPNSKFTISAVQQGLSTDINEPWKAATFLKVGRASTEAVLSSAQRSGQEARQSYNSLVTRDYLLHPKSPEPERNPSESRDSQQDLSYPTNPSSYDDVTDNNNQILFDDGSYNVREALARGRHLAPSLSSKNSATCYSMSKTTDVAPTDEMDCEHAARIIARMRGSDDHESLWPELGCSVDGNCTIRKVRLFQMA